jgi:hypothetical protein
MNGVSPEPSVAGAVAELKARVRRRLGERVHGFRLVVAGNGLILRGSARSYYVKQLAQQAVRGATELPIVANEMEVSRPFWRGAVV